MRFAAWWPDLWRSVDQVTLVDADGRVDFKQRSSNAAEAESQEAMEAKLVAMLEPLAGRDNVRATVNVSYDEGSEERTDEVYDPSQVAALTTQKSEQISVPRGQPSGVPGTASNSPGGSPMAQWRGRRRRRRRGLRLCFKSRLCQFIRGRAQVRGRVFMPRTRLMGLQNIWCIPTGPDESSCRRRWS